MRIRNSTRRTCTGLCSDKGDTAHRLTLPLTHFLSRAKLIKRPRSNQQEESMLLTRVNESILLEKEDKGVSECRSVLSFFLIPAPLFFFFLVVFIFCCYSLMTIDRLEQTSSQAETKGKRKG